MPRNNRGSATLEASATISVLFTFVGGLLLVTYLLFARGWIQYQTEQGLYCLAEGRGGGLCRAQLRARLNAFLPWGEMADLRLARENQTWHVRLQWKLLGYRVKIDKSLSPQIITANRVLL